MQTKIIGHTKLQIPIVAHEFGSAGPEVLVLGGVHGDEPEGIAAAQALLARFVSDFSYKLRLVLIPCLNLDGCLAHTRVNGAGVDLNRNLPTKDWSPEVRAARYHPGPAPGSEPENQVLMKLIENHQFKLVVSLHSWEPVINTNGDCKGEAEILAKWTGYKIDDYIGYPTPGSLGTYAGLERQIPTITYEIQRDLPLNEVVAKHVEPLCHALKYTEAHR